MAEACRCVLRRRLRNNEMTTCSLQNCDDEGLTTIAVGGYSNK